MNSFLLGRGASYEAPHFLIYGYGEDLLLMILQNGQYGYCNVYNGM